MRVTEAAATKTVASTEGFSFAYLKELLVSSMMEWVPAGGSRTMDHVIAAQTELLRGQLNDKKEAHQKKAAGSRA
jgi:hypothetical protein